MQYRIRFSSAPRLLLLAAFLAVLTGAAVLLVLLVGVLPGVIACIVIGYVDFIVLRHMYKQLSTRVESGEDGLSINLYGEENHSFVWQDFTLSGLCTRPNRGTSLFLYVASSDKLIEIPAEFAGFDGLVGELRHHLSLTEIHLPEGSSLRDKVKELLEKT